MSGYKSWSSPEVNGNLWIAGREFTGKNWFFSWEDVPGGSGVITPSGVVSQAAPGHPNAVTNIARRRITIRFKPQLSQADARHLKRLAHLAEGAGGVPLAQPWEEEVMWAIRDPGTRTQFSLPHPAPFGTRSYVEPTADIVTSSGAVSQALTIVNSGTPTSTELKISNSTDATFVETGDISAHVGKFLALSYMQLMNVRVEDFRRDVEAYNDLSDELVLEEWPLEVDWTGDDP